LPIAAALLLRRRGRQLADLLKGSWRQPAPPLVDELPTDELERLWPLAAGSGAIGLLWRRLEAERTRPEQGALLERIQHGYFQQRLDARRYEQSAQVIITALQAAGIRPLLIKGWSVARHYPEPGLRPYTDIDLVVAPGEHRAAVDVLVRAEVPLSVDLHHRVPHALGRDLDAMAHRRQRVTLGRVQVDVLGPEDHLRLLCLHLLVHGAERTIWLCDLALLLDLQRATLDWDYLLAGDARASDAVLCALALAHRILGVSLDGTPAAERAARLPAWLSDCVLEHWGRGYQPHGQLGMIPRSPRALWRAARERWPNPIAATASLGAPYNGFPRAPIQLADYLWRSVGLLRRLTAKRGSSRSLQRSAYCRGG